MLARPCSVLLSIVCLVNLAMSNSASAQEPAKIKVGMIGLDTSHVVAFTSALKKENAAPELKAIEIIAGFPGGSPDIPDSANRVEKFTEQLRGMGVEIVESIDDLLTKVDAVLLESVDGRPHLAQARPVIKAGKPLFIDKPIAGTLADAIEIFELAKEAKVPLFSSSSLRFSPGIIGMRNDPKVGAVKGCDTYGPCSLEPHHPDLFWYGVHGCEMLFTVMGTGCTQVTRVHTPDTDLGVGTWKDNRVGTFRGARGYKAGYGGMVFGDAGAAPTGSYAGYEPLLVEIAKFFQTKQPPVSAEETIELFAFMEAADESKRQSGAAVTIESVLTKARAQVAERRSGAKP